MQPSNHPSRLRRSWCLKAAAATKPSENRARRSRREPGWWMLSAAWEATRGERVRSFPAGLHTRPRRGRDFSYSQFRTEGLACLDVGNGRLWPAGRLAAALRPHGTRRVTRADTPCQASPDTAKA